MNAAIQFLWGKIDGYKDKEESILDIYLDAKLAIEIALGEATTGKETQLLKTLEELKEIAEKTPFNDYNIYELHNWIIELKENTYWRDYIKIQDEKISRTEIKKWCNETYNEIRALLLATNLIDLNIGSSGKQSTAEV